MVWLYLTLSGLLEIAWALRIKRTKGFTRSWPSIYTPGTAVVGPRWAEGR